MKFLLPFFLLVLTAPSALAKMRAMSYGNVFGRQTDTEFMTTGSGRSLSKLKNLNVDYLAITIYAQQSSRESTEIVTDSDLDNIRYVIGHAQAMGMKTFLKPVIEVCCPRVWRGFIKPTRAWYNAYGKWIGELAEFAEREGVDLFSIGSEFVNADNSTEADWRNIAKDIRSKYNGEITYIANHESHGQVKFWDALDYIGISAYYELVSDQKTTAPSLKDTIKLWEVKTSEMEEWRKNNGYEDKQVILGEMGYQSKGNGVGWRKSFDWTVEAPFSEDEQDTLYKAAFEAWYKKPWVEGIFVWYWESDENAGKSGESRLDYTPQNKKAELTLKKYYSSRR